MGSHKTVSINGKHYDALTGLPLEATHTATKTTVHAASVHAAQQKSTTLNRRAVHKKQAVKSVPHKKHSQSMDFARAKQRRQVPKSPAISRFAKDPVAVHHTVTTAPDVQAVDHPLAVKAKVRHAVAPAKPQPAVMQPTHHAHSAKQQAIAKALANAAPTKAEKRSLKSRFPRLMSVGSASLAVLLIAGYLTYINMPTISIRVAAAQAGIDASYPGYHPTGYRLSGPIAWNDGSVSMRFAANAGPQNFTISEKKSTWDSSAVLENYVQPRVGSNYTPQTQNGLTVYTFDNNAVWVNGGILYTIEGDAPLSNEQILHIATSL